MAAEIAPALRFEKLKIISRVYPRAATRVDSSIEPSGPEPTEPYTVTRAPSDRSGNEFVNVYVPLSPIDQQPFVIGTGGFASVFLAFQSESTDGEPLAVKLLKKEQGTGTPNGRYRFIEEIFYNQKLSVQNGSTFVGYLGFGYLGDSATPSTSDVEEKENAWVLRGIQAADLQTMRDENSRPKMSRDFLSGHQNLFFVMAAAWCSLEQLLVSNQPLHQSNTLNLTYREASSQRQEPRFWRRNTAFGARHENLGSDEIQKTQVASVAKDLGICDTSSGLEILSKIRTHRKWGVPVATRMLLRIMGSLTHAVSRIHRFQDVHESGDVKSENIPQLAHRDLKPANFLISDCDGEAPRILLADLGFIAAERDGKSMFGPVHEPGALAQGTVMYQAPEQMLSGREVSFELIHAAAHAKHQTVRGPTDHHTHEAQPAGPAIERRAPPVNGAPLVDGKYLPHSIRVRTVGGIQLDPEDRIISSEIKLRYGGDGGRMRISDIEQDPMYPTSAIAVIAQQIDPEQTPRAEYKGTLVKPVGQHSDLFALGCHAYFMASGGKDPGEFYRTYLRPGSGLIHLDEDAPHDDCLRIATFLANRNGARAQLGEVGALAASLGANPWLELLKSAPAQLASIEPTRDHFLFTTDRKPIGIIFLYIIVSLMCRDADGSYASGGPSKEPRTWTLRSLTGLNAFINDATESLVERYPVLRDDPFQRSWGGGLNALVKIRLLAPPGS